MRTYKLGMASVLCLATWFGCSSFVDLDHPYKPAPGSSSGEMGGSGGAGGTGGMGGIAMACMPGTTESCYDGPPETQGLGACHAGVRICNVEGTGFGECTNQVTPNAEDCTTPIDDDCNGVVNDTGPNPTPTAPALGETVPGGSITLEWTGGLPPYQVELAFDAAFTDPVTSIPPIIVWDTTATVDGINGGYFYWRVRSLGGCGPSEFTEARELHVTCRPIQLTNTPNSNEMVTAVAWNATDREYGVIISAWSDELNHPYFSRIDRMGNMLLPPTELSGPVLPDLGGGGYWSPDLVYIPANGKWATSFHREDPDQSYVAIFDNTGVAERAFELDDAYDSEAHSISFVPATSRIVAMTDYAGNNGWSSHAYTFDSWLTGPLVSSDVGQNPSWSSGARGGRGVDLSGVAGFEHQVLFAYQFDSSGSGPHYLMVQRMDAMTGALAWPEGTSLPSVPGKWIGGDVTNHYFSSGIAINPIAKVAAVTYTADLDGDSNWGEGDSYVAFLDIETGDSIAPTIYLNASLPGTTTALAPGIAWDGEEFMVMTYDNGDSATSVQMRLTKISGTGQLIGTGYNHYPQPGFHHYFEQKAIVGANRIHAVGYGHTNANGEKYDAWLCIEPPYN